MRIGEKIQQIIEKEGVTKTFFAEKIGFTPQGLNNVLQKSDVSTQILDKIIKTFNVPPAYFFDEEYKLEREAEANPKKKEAKTNVTLLKKRLKDSETRVALLMEQIDRLTAQLSSLTNQSNTLTGLLAK